MMRAAAALGNRAEVARTQLCDYAGINRIALAVFRRLMMFRR
jgi:hypothetical protein